MSEAPTVDFWAAMFDGLAASYDQSGVPFFGPIAQGLVRRLAPAPGERVLDLGAATVRRRSRSRRPSGPTAR